MQDACSAPRASPLQSPQRTSRILSCLCEQTVFLPDFGQLTASEQGVACKNCLLIPILEEETDTILRMTWRMYTSYRDVPKLESLTMTWSFCGSFAVLASDNVKFGVD
jgi:hypothetical protein